MKIDVLDINGKKKREVSLDEKVFNGEVNTAVLHQVMVAYNANRRQGTASTKTRGDVSGGGKKPWRQKGTGRARVGSSRNPVWVGGGIAHGPKPRDYSQKISKKLKQVSLKSAIQDHINNNTLKIIDKLTFSAPKTKDFVAVLQNFNMEKAEVILVVGELTQEIRLSARNLPNVRVLSADKVTGIDILLYDEMIATEEAMRMLSDRVTKTIKR